MKARFAALAAGFLALTVAAAAAAEPMDPALERLVVDQSCHDQMGHYSDGTSNLDQLEKATGARWCLPDHAAFAKLMNQYGFALAPTAMHSARTTGFGGFHFSIEADYTKISKDADYWHKGTQGNVDTSTNKASIVNNGPPSVLQLYSAKIRKSFGFGLEMTGIVGFMPQTSILSGGADVRMSLLEGFRTGFAGILPDVAVGGGVRTITGTPEFQLTIASLDVQISKPLPIADSSIITPWVGYQYVWIFADSGLIDLTPATDAVQYCNYSGKNVPGNADTAKTVNGNQVYDGQPVCNGGSPLDFNNNAVFNKARIQRQRLIFGLNYRYEMVMFGGEFITDIVNPGDTQSKADMKAALKNEKRQWTIALELGTMF
jgi:hypothetical protein